MNCDGYLDLSLLTVAGAENVYSTFALWNKKANRFDPVITIQPWLTDVQHFSDERVQELLRKTIVLCCNGDGEDVFSLRISRVYTSISYCDFKFGQIVTYPADKRIFISLFDGFYIG